MLCHMLRSHKSLWFVLCSKYVFEQIEESNASVGILCIEPSNNYWHFLTFNTFSSFSHFSPPPPILSAWKVPASLLCCVGALGRVARICQPRKWCLWRSWLPIVQAGWCFWGTQSKHRDSVVDNMIQNLKMNQTKKTRPSILRLPQEELQHGMIKPERTKKERSTKLCLKTTIKKTSYSKTAKLLCRTFLTSSATFCLAMALFTFSYITVFWIAIPQKIANAYFKKKKRDNVNVSQGLIKV